MRTDIKGEAKIVGSYIHKTYRKEEYAIKAFEAQTLGFQAGYAPRPIELIGNILVSEIADLSIQSILKPGVYYSNIFVDMHNTILEIFNKVGIRQDKKEFMRTDLTNHNIGLIDNKIVLIDWS